MRVNIPANPVIQLDYTAVVGGTGGTPFQVSCNADEALVGVYGNWHDCRHVRQSRRRAMHPGRPGRALDRQPGESRHCGDGDGHGLYQDLPARLCDQRLSAPAPHSSSINRLPMPRADRGWQGNRHGAVPGRRRRPRRHGIRGRSCLLDQQPGLHARGDAREPDRCLRHAVPRGADHAGRHKHAAEPDQPGQPGHQRRRRGQSAGRRDRCRLPPTH